MKYFLLIILTSIFVNVKSQTNNIRAIYEYKYAPDSTRLDSTFSELMYLDINISEGSRFYSRDVFVGDSLMHEALNKQKNNTKVNVKLNNYGKIRDVVKKFYPNFKIQTTTRIGMDQYIYSDGRKINWEVLSKKETIENFKTQKATAKIYGRTWEAWFTEEIPMNDGPYKFYGLPGLIVKIQDVEKGHIFTLKAIKSLKENEVWPLEIVNKSRKKKIEIDFEKYKKLYLQNRNDPMVFQKPIMGGMINLQVTNSSGEPIDKRELEKIRLKKLAKDNNILELDLIKNRD